MPEIKLITPAQEAELLGAMTAAISDANSGMTPDAAIAKHASDRGFGPEFAGRMVEAYNSSRTIKHLRDTSGEKRAESFPLADVQSVLKIMYGEVKQPEVKKAAVGKILKFDFNVAEPEDPRAMLKSAEYAAPAPEAGRVITQVRGVLDKMAMGQRRLKMEADHAREQAMNAIQGVVECFKRADNQVEFHDLEAQVVSNHGQLGKKAMDIVWQLADFEAMGEKRAGVVERPRSMGPQFICAQAGRMIEALQKAGEALVEFKDFEVKSAAAAEYLGKKIEPVIKLVPRKLNRLPVKKPGTVVDAHTKDPSALDVRAKQRKTAAENDKDGGQDAMKKMVESIGEGNLRPFAVPTWIPEAIYPKDAKEPAPPGIVTPEHESRMRAVKMKLIANDLISNDPVLSSYAPADVFSAVNQLSELAPAVLTNPFLLKSLTARILIQRGSLDPSEISQILDTEGKQRQLSIKGF